MKSRNFMLSRIVREFNLLKAKNQFEAEKIKHRFFEIAKSIKEPIAKFYSNNTTDFVSIKSKDGVVEYRLISNFKECKKVLEELRSLNA